MLIEVNICINLIQNSQRFNDIFDVLKCVYKSIKRIIKCEMLNF